MGYARLLEIYVCMCVCLCVYVCMRQRPNTLRGQLQKVAGVTQCCLRDLLNLEGKPHIFFGSADNNDNIDNNNNNNNNIGYKC